MQSGVGAPVRWGLVAAAVLAAAGVPASGSPPTVRPPTAVAVVGDSAINPLHAEFRTSDGRNPAYPSGMPAPVMIPFPTSGDFEAAMDELRAGPLGAPAPGGLYAIEGTRLLLFAGDGTVDLLADGTARSHGTAVASAAGGRRLGASPDSLIVHVPVNDGDSFEWLARQRWIDLASTSVYTVRSTEPCESSAEVRDLHADGGLLFASSGNTVDGYEPVSFPNGMPEVFQVGGVDGQGRTWLPGQIDQASVFFAVGTVVRPYEVGARFSFPAADGDSFTKFQPFGGTSGATPTVAGYAVELIAEARRILGDPGPRSAAAMARRHPNGIHPGRGPLADGDFTRDELVELIHRTATPFEPASPARYGIEGYGAFDDRSQTLAIEVLRGMAPMPTRPAEDAAHAEAEELRRIQASRC